MQWGVCVCVCVGTWCGGCCCCCSRCCRGVCVCVCTILIRHRRLLQQQPLEGGDKGFNITTSTTTSSSFSLFPCRRSRRLRLRLEQGTQFRSAPLHHLLGKTQQLSCSQRLALRHDTHIHTIHAIHTAADRGGQPTQGAASRAVCLCVCLCVDVCVFLLHRCRVCDRVTTGGVFLLLCWPADGGGGRKRRR